MKQFKIALGFGLMMCSILALIAETPEERLLKKKEQRILNYTYQAKSGNREIKVSVLDKILEEFSEAKYSSEDKKLVELVVFLSEEGSVRQEYENNRLINDYPDVRRKACMVLAKLGGEQSRDALITILSSDTNSTVKAEACIALSQIGDSTTGEALRALVYSYRATYKPDNNFVFAVINAVKAIAKGDSTAYGDAILILSEIQMGQFNKKVRDAAYDAIQSLNELN